MKKEDLTREKLVKAAEDLNKVLDLNPKIVVEFESSLKGAALKSVEKKFMNQLEKDVAEAATLVTATDVLLDPTVDALETLGVSDIRAMLTGGTTSPAEKEQKSVPSKKKENEKEKKGGEKEMAKSKKKVIKEVKKTVTAEKDPFGFRKGSKSSEAVGLLASGKMTAKDVKKKFDMLSFGKLLKDLEGRGFKIKEDDKGKCSVTGKLKI